MTTHARQQVLDYFAALLTDELGIRCDIQRVSPIPPETKESLNLIIDDESVNGDDDNDEYEDTLGVVARIAPMVVEISVLSAVSQRRVNELCADVETVLSAADGCGDHVIRGAHVSCQYAGMTNEPDGEGQQDQFKTSLIFQTSYRTEAGKPLALV